MPRYKVFCLITLLLLSFSQGQSQEKIKELINKLGAEKFDEREKAFEALIEIGTPGIKFLEEEVRKNPDPEIRWRAERLAKLIHVWEKLSKEKLTFQEKMEVTHILAEGHFEAKVNLIVSNLKGNAKYPISDEGLATVLELTLDAQKNLDSHTISSLIFDLLRVREERKPQIIKGLIKNSEKILTGEGCEGCDPRCEFINLLANHGGEEGIKKLIEALDIENVDNKVKATIVLYLNKSANPELYKKITEIEIGEQKQKLVSTSVKAFLKEISRADVGTEMHKKIESLRRPSSFHWNTKESNAIDVMGTLVMNYLGVATSVEKGIEFVKEHLKEKYGK
jgi:hypothetical protein